MRTTIAQNAVKTVYRPRRNYDGLWGKVNRGLAKPWPALRFRNGVSMGVL